MREILFRGKRVDNGDWIYGDLRHWRNGTVGIHSDAMKRTLEVIPESVGQDIGLTDKRGYRIFEGDIVQYVCVDGNLSDCICKVQYGVFNCSCCDGVYGWEFAYGDIRYSKDYVVTGNIHDNPESLDAEVKNNA